MDSLNSNDKIIARIAEIRTAKAQSNSTLTIEEVHSKYLELDKEEQQLINSYTNGLLTHIDDQVAAFNTTTDGREDSK